jgi:hypothetical protein
VLERARARKNLRYVDLNREMKAYDLISIEDPGARVHIVFTDGGSICRPSILQGGTARRERRTWEILGSVIDFADYRKAVWDLGRVPCENCLARYK